MATTENPHAEPAGQTLFEISWEVCNKVGGIYTVVRSKAPFVAKKYSRYITIGPAFDELGPEFDPRPTPPEFQAVFEALKTKHGIICHYGVWLIPGMPVTILVDFRSVIARRNDLKAFYWERFRVDSIKAAWEFDEPLCFSTAAGMLVEEYARRANPIGHVKDAARERIVAQCHEWIAGFAILHLKAYAVDVATVFTTHATMLGRSIAGNGHLLYEIIDHVNPMDWAYRLNVQDKHTAEVACAHNADVFTTVSEITGMEAERLLGKKPDVLLYNGFHIDSFPTFEETSSRHLQSKEFLKEFAAYNFFPYYSFDLDKTLFYFTSGRYEFQNKGMDIFVEALGQLNRKLIEERSDKTIVVFFWVIMGKGTVRSDVMENKSFYQHVKSTVDWQGKYLLQRLVLDILSGHRPGEDDVFTSSIMNDLYSGIHRLRRTGNPPLVTHDIGNWDNDPLVQACRAQGLLNAESDRVKIVIYPGYLDGTDGLLNLHYYDAVVGTHLGVFASSYEPWGYTPLENAALGVPAITTDLAGFGRYLSMQGSGNDGIVGDRSDGQFDFVLRRFKRPRAEVVSELARRLQLHAKLGHAERVQQGFVVKSMASLCDWNNFVKHYITAHNLAIERHG